MVVTVLVVVVELTTAEVAVTVLVVVAQLTAVEVVEAVKVVPLCNSVNWCGAKPANMAAAIVPMAMASATTPDVTIFLVVLMPLGWEPDLLEPAFLNSALEDATLFVQFLEPQDIIELGCVVGVVHE